MVSEIAVEMCLSSPLPQVTHGLVDRCVFDIWVLSACALAPCVKLELEWLTASLQLMHLLSSERKLDSLKGKCVAAMLQVCRDVYSLVELVAACMVEESLDASILILQNTMMRSSLGITNILGSDTRY